MKVDGEQKTVAAFTDLFN